MARFLVQTIPNKLPELLINLSSQGPHLMGATLPTLLRAVHPPVQSQWPITARAEAHENGGGRAEGRTAPPPLYKLEA